VRTPKLALLPIVFCAALAVALPVFGQSGLRVPQRGEPGLDPALARGWLAPDMDRYGFALYPWRDTMGYAPRGDRMNWSYAFGGRANLGMSLMNGMREFDAENRQYSLFGRYSLTQDWALSAETMSRDPSGLFRLQDLRIGVQRRF
jgi:hypothetical protein